MKKLKSDPAPLDEFEDAILSTALSVVTQKALESGFEGCDAARNAIASFANYAATKALRSYGDTPCPDHKTENVILSGLVYSLTFSIVELSKRSKDRVAEGERLTLFAASQLHRLVSATLTERAATHDVAGGMQ